MGGIAATSYIHATAVVIGEAGVLICGPSGAGKSMLASNLIAAAEAAGDFARLVGDDRVGISLHGGRVIAQGHPSIQGQIERRGQGIVAARFLTAAVVRAVIQLASDPVPRYPGQDEDQFLLENVKLPCLRIWHDAAPACHASAILADLRLRRIIS